MSADGLGIGGFPGGGNKVGKAGKVVLAIERLTP